MEKTYLKVKRGVVGGECSVQLWVYLQRGGETTSTRDGRYRRGGGGKMTRKKGREMVYRKGEGARKEGEGR